MVSVDLRLGDCLEILPTLASQSVDAVITDPPYPCIKRDYGMLSEVEWWDLMMSVCREVRRILKPTGSAVFILQPNSHKVGSVRGWLWEFMAWVCREWNMIQDVWWWNTVVCPNGLTTTGGLLRGSIKACVWAGDSSCYRNQDLVLWTEAQASIARNATLRAGRHYSTSGHSRSELTARLAAIKRGGVTPFNVLPFANTSNNGGSADGHGASTPLALAEWWTRYICPPGGVVLDPFIGSGTMGLAALKYGNSIVGIEKMPQYFEITQRRLSEMLTQLQLPMELNLA